MAVVENSAFLSRRHFMRSGMVAAVAATPVAIAAVVEARSVDEQIVDHLNAAMRLMAERVSGKWRVVMMPDINVAMISGPAPELNQKM